MTLRTFESGNESKWTFRLVEWYNLLLRWVNTITFVCSYSVIVIIYIFISLYFECFYYFKTTLLKQQFDKQQQSIYRTGWFGSVKKNLLFHFVLLFFVSIVVVVVFLHHNRHYIVCRQDSKLAHNDLRSIN